MRLVLTNLIVFLVSVSSFALNQKYDPDYFEQTHKTEYARYLKKLFEQSPQVKIQKVAAKPKLIKGTSAYRFRTEIRRQTQSTKEANFAGKWILVVVGCGTGCAQYFLVDTQSGDVSDPHLMTENGNSFFKADKNLLVVGGSDTAQTLEDARKGVWGGPKAWTWNQKNFEQVALN